jgi:hypothetical protein
MSIGCVPSSASSSIKTIGGNFERVDPSVSEDWEKERVKSKVERMR